MNNYDDSIRGTFQSEEKASQLVKFDGLLYKGKSGALTVTPTDIDGLIQLDVENCIILFELKYQGGMPEGQKQAYSKLCDAIEGGGVNCVVFLAEHETDYPAPIMAKDARVTEVYRKESGWRNIRHKGRKLGEIIANYIIWIRGKEDSNATLNTI